MQLAVGIPLIIVGFLIPVIGYLLYRRYQKKKAQEKLTKGEIFDKEGDHFAYEEEGTDHEIPSAKKQQQQSSTAQDALNKLESYLKQGQQQSEERNTEQQQTQVGYQYKLINADTQKFTRGQNQRWELIYVVEDISLRRIPQMKSSENKLQNASPSIKVEDIDDNNGPTNTPDGKAPGEEEKQMIKGDEIDEGGHQQLLPASFRPHQNSDNYQETSALKTTYRQLTSPAAQEKSGPLVILTPDNSMFVQPMNNGDQSLGLVGDISAIHPNEHERKMQQSTPGFKDKQVINFVDEEEDLSMLKEMFSNRSQTALLIQQNQNKETTRIKERDHPSITKDSPLKKTHAQTNSQTDIQPNSASKDDARFRLTANLKMTQQNQFLLGKQDPNIDLESNSSFDFSVQVAESVHYNDVQHMPYHKSASKHMELTRRLFKRPLNRRPTQNGTYRSSHYQQQINKTGQIQSSHGFVLEDNDEEANPVILETKQEEV